MAVFRQLPACSQYETVLGIQMYLCIYIYMLLQHRYISVVLSDSVIHYMTKILSNGKIPLALSMKRNEECFFLPFQCADIKRDP